MSGPWDRPPFPGPDGDEWPSEELDTPSSSPPSPEPWSADDPWQESRSDSASGWDAWPSSPAPPDDYVIEEPDRPSSDPWAESWTDDDPTLPTAPEEAPQEPVTADAWQPPPQPAAAGFVAVEPEVVEPEVVAPEVVEPEVVEPEVVEPEAAASEMFDERPAREPIPEQPAAELIPDEPAAPLAEPWAATDDPWAAAALADPWVEAVDTGQSDQAAELEAETWGPPQVEAASVAAAESPITESPITESPPEPIEPDWLPDEPDDPATLVGEGVEAIPDVQADDDPAAIAALAALAAQPGAPAQEELGAPEELEELEAQEEPEPEAAPNPFPFLEDGWPNQSDATQVLPSSWEPTQPATRPVDLEPTSSDIRTSLALNDDASLEEAVPAPTTAEQAVPWLIGIILLLAGMVIVLLALIFAGDGSLRASSGPTPSASALVGLPNETAPASPEATLAPSSSTVVPTESAAPTPTPVPPPVYGPLEMAYQGRAAALAPIYLLHHDFTTADEPRVLAQDPALDVRRMAWSPDGTVGAGLLADVLVSIKPGEEKRRLGDGISTVTFGEDAALLYAVRVTQDGDSDVAHVLAIDYASGDTSELASITYPRPVIGEQPAPAEAQFSDDGGSIRLFWMDDGSLRLWALGGGTWGVDPESGDVTDVAEALPLLWSPDGRHRVTIEEADGATTLRLTNHEAGALASTTATGLVSHLRWSPDGERIVFTLGRPTSGGGVLQDLFLWDLEDGVAPTQLTSTGAAFGAEWLGTTARWEAG